MYLPKIKEALKDDKFKVRPVFDITNRDRIVQPELELKPAGIKFKKAKASGPTTERENLILWVKEKSL